MGEALAVAAEAAIHGGGARPLRRTPSFSGKPRKRSASSSSSMRSSAEATRSTSSIAVPVARL